MLTAPDNYDTSRHRCNYCAEASGMKTILGYILCLACFICPCGKAPEDRQPELLRALFEALVALPALYGYLLASVAIGINQCLFPKFLLID